MELDYIFLVNPLEINLSDVKNIGSSKEIKKKMYKFFLIMPRDIMDKEIKKMTADIYADLISKFILPFIIFQIIGGYIVIRIL